MIKRDYHVHTYLSPCARPHAHPDDYRSRVAECGLCTVGFTDHVWDPAIPGASGINAELTVERTMRIRDQIPEDFGAKVCFGCEAEMNSQNEVCMSADSAKLYDYVLVATTHYPTSYLSDHPDLAEDSDYVRKYTLERTYAAIESDVVTGLAHPFYLFGGYDILGVLAGYTDDEYAKVFRAAAVRHKSVEINGHIFLPQFPRDSDGFAYEFKRMFTIAAEEGCLFHFGSDAHATGERRFYKEVEELAKICGIPHDRFVPLEELAKESRE